jgi:hypothetical protein
MLFLLHTTSVEISTFANIVWFRRFGLICHREMQKIGQTCRVANFFACSSVFCATQRVCPERRAGTSDSSCRLECKPNRFCGGPSPLKEVAAERAGGCLCGAVRYRLAGSPGVHCCHCDMCRRATGSAFAVLAWIPFERLFWTSGRPRYRRSSPLAERGFCPECGSPLSLI